VRVLAFRKGCESAHTIRVDKFGMNYSARARSRAQARGNSPPVADADGLKLRLIARIADELRAFGIRSRLKDVAAFRAYLMDVVIGTVRGKEMDTFHGSSLLAFFGARCGCAWVRRHYGRKCPCGACGREPVRGLMHFPSQIQRLEVEQNLWDSGVGEMAGNGNSRNCPQEGLFCTSPSACSAY
jgi:hypothetical protein